MHSAQASGFSFLFFRLHARSVNFFAAIAARNPLFTWVFASFAYKKSNTPSFWYNVVDQNHISKKGIVLLMDIIQYLIQLCHLLYQQNCWLISFICRYIPLKQWAFDDSHSPEYQNTGWTNLRSSAMSALLRRTGIGRIF